MFLSLISLIACISYFFTGKIDQSELGVEAVEPGQVRNWLGKTGAGIANLIIFRGFGLVGLLIPAYGLLLGLLMLEDDYYAYAKKLLKYILFILFFGTIFISFVELLIDPMSAFWGGGVGVSINYWLFARIGKVGVTFLILFFIVLFFVLNYNAELRASGLINTLKTKMDKGLIPKGIDTSKAKKTLGKTFQKKDPTAQPTTTTEKPAPNTQPLQEPAFSVSGDESSVRPDQPLTLEFPSTAIKPREDNPKKPGDDLEFTIVTPQDEPKLVISDPIKLEQLGEDNVGIDEQGNAMKIVPDSDLEIENAEDYFDDELYDPTQELSDYEKPRLELLEDHGSGRGREVDRQELEDNKNKIVKTLSDYGISIESIKATVGPTVTLYEIVPSAGVRISKIRNLEDDIALNLAALGIRIIAPIPGKGTIGIEVPNSNPEIVSLRGVFQTEKYMTTKAELPIALGRTISNEVFIADLNKMPHLLIAGATGQGKSVGLNTVIASILYKKHPAEVKFVLIDPKKVEMSLYASLRNHFLAQLPEQGDEPIVTDVRDAVNVLKSLCVEMDRRYDLLKKARVRNLKEYNTKFTSRKLNPRKGHEFLPYIVLIIDELADMMMTAGKEVEMPIARLAQLARAVGIHLVVATQRPSVNVITGIIKANFPARLSYRVISKVDSRTILDANGADQLVGRGDLLLSTGNEIIRIQNAFIDTPEIERVVDFISKQRGFTEPYLLPEIPIEGGDDLDDEDEIFEKDSRFEEAARLIVRFQIGSASLIQRKMKLGYNRAGRIIDQLERAGVVGAHSGSKARDVLVTDEAELERYLSNMD
ncbi:MAG: DNA translocase FtsK [Bacteroidia bacterium]|nr:DNA translocase FtsK [Bacteroidia bacterium]